MAPKLFNKRCQRCEKSYYTYDESKDFCTDICKGKCEYAKFFNKAEPIHEEKFCLWCNAILGFKQRKFCEDGCKKKFNNQQSRDQRAVLPKKKSTRKPIPYEVLNRMAEHKRVFEDHYGLYRKNNDRI